MKLVQRVILSQKYAHLFELWYMWFCYTEEAEEEGLMNKGRYHLLLLHEQALDKKGIAESLHTHTNKS